MAPSLRSAQDRDITSLVELEDRVFAGDRLSRRSFRRLIGGRTCDAIVAEEGDGIVGYALVLYREGSAAARLYSIAVDPGAAGTGLGRALLDAAEAAASLRAKALLRLEVREDNSRAVELYRMNGYRPAGRIEGYYEDGMAALRKEKELCAAAVIAVPHDLVAGRAVIPGKKQRQ